MRYPSLQFSEEAGGRHQESLERNISRGIADLGDSEELLPVRRQRETSRAQHQTFQILRDLEELQALREESLGEIFRQK